jgi:hypothetical protein
MAKELLPIGSVVQLENSSGLVMIAGYLPVTPSRPDYVWDYSGFQFPLGYTDDDQVYCFDHKQIEIVYARGYQDIEEETFMNKVTEARDRVEEEARARAVGAESEHEEGEKEE